MLDRIIASIDSRTLRKYAGPSCGSKDMPVDSIEARLGSARLGSAADGLLVIGYWTRTSATLAELLGWTLVEVQ